MVPMLLFLPRIIIISNICSLCSILFLCVNDFFDYYILLQALRSALHFACKKNSIDMCLILLDAGANSTLTDNVILIMNKLSIQYFCSKFHICYQSAWPCGIPISQHQFFPFFLGCICRCFKLNQIFKIYIFYLFSFCLK